MSDATSSDTAQTSNVATLPPNYSNSLAPGGDGSSYTGPTYNPDANTYTRSLIKEALVYNRDKSIFTQLGTNASLVRNMGMTLEQFIEVPLLDDRNINDQGINAQGMAIKNGNLYGSSTSIGEIEKSLPTLVEGGGRYNRVGLTRIKRSTTLKQYGIFTELDNYMLQFDNQIDLGASIIRRELDGVVEMIDHMTQYRVLQNVGTAVYTGGVSQLSDMSPDAKGTTAADANGSLLQSGHLFRLEELLNNNRTPLSSVLLGGSQNFDTRTVRNARIAFVGVEMANYLRTLTDSFGRQAFIDVSQYSSQGHVIEGEIGSIGGFRVVQVRRMLHWGGEGAVASGSNAGRFRTSMGADGEERYNVYPFLVVGDEAFATSSLEMSNGEYRLNIITKYPGRETAHGFNDPFGERGFSSVKFWHGVLPLKTERIACIYSLLPTL